jgi:hypothetical protein
VSVDDSFSTADVSTIVAQELLGRRSRLAEEVLLSPCAGGMEWTARLLSTGWIAVGDEIWLDMAAAACIFGYGGRLSDDSFGLSGAAICSRIRTQGSSDGSGGQRCVDSVERGAEVCRGEIQSPL